MKELLKFRKCGFGFFCLSKIIKSYTLVGCNVKRTNLHQAHNPGKVGVFLSPVMAKTRNQLSCQSGRDHLVELCHSNNRWLLDADTWLIQTYCDHGAYLTSSAWFIESHDGVAPRQLEHSNFDWNFEDSKKQIIETIIATGFIRTFVLTDATFDPSTKVISHRNYCCAGDVSKRIHWLAKDCTFQRQHMTVDGI